MYARASSTVILSSCGTRYVSTRAAVSYSGSKRDTSTSHSCAIVASSILQEKEEDDQPNASQAPDQPPLPTLTHAKVREHDPDASHSVKHHNTQHGEAYWSVEGIERMPGEEHNEHE